jgi:membrane protein implicated in regulation of membrane protease activity
MQPWQVLALIGASLAVLEFFTPSFFMLPAGIAFLLTALVAAFTADWPTLIGVLVVSLVLVYGVFSLLIWPKLRREAPRTGADGMAGKVAVVTEALVPGGGGYVKLYGDTWQAVAEQRFEVGQKVRITGTDGNKVLVEALEPRRD